LLSKRDTVGWRLLHWAALCGYERVVQRLLENGADIAEGDRYQRTALYWAAMWGREAVGELLLEKGLTWSPRTDWVAGRRSYALQ
jgi:ankyrin repeat protein